MEKAIKKGTLHADGLKNGIYTTKKDSSQARCFADHLGERCVRIAEVKGSNPSRSTKAKILSTAVGRIFALYS